MRFVVLDPGLASNTGHHYNYDTALLGAATQMGMDTFLYHHCLLDHFPLPVARQGAFAMSPYAARDTEALSLGACDTDLARIPARNFTDDDILFFSILLPGNMPAVGRWLRSLYETAAPRVVLQIWSGAFGQTGNPEQDALHEDILADFAQTLDTIGNRRILALCTEFDTRPCIKDRFAQRIGLCEQYVNMVPAQYLDTPAWPKRPGEITVGFFGHGEWNKGIHFIPVLAWDLLERREDVRFLIQVNAHSTAHGAAQGTPLRATLDALQSHPRFHMIEGALEMDDYFGLVSTADIVLMPYHPTRQGHGVFWDAAAMGKVVVMPSYHKIVPYFRTLGGMLPTFDDWTVEAVAAALDDAVERFNVYRDAASRTAPTARAHIDAQHLFGRLMHLLDTLDASPRAWHGTLLDTAAGWLHTSAEKGLQQ